METVSITSGSGKIVQLSIRTPNTAINGVILINTGTCIPQKIYWKFADFLCRNNYVAITYDYSDAANYQSNVSHIDWIKDIGSAIDYLIEHYPNEKKYLVGHSSGGQLVGFAPNAKYLDKLFLVASANGYWKNLPSLNKVAMLLFWYVLVPLNIAINGYFNNKMYGVSGGFPKNIILELRQFCLNKDFFIPFFKQKNMTTYYHDITCPVIAYHLEDDVIANRPSCEYILNLYTHADKRIETLIAKDYGIKKFGHRGFFFAVAEEQLWQKFLKDLVA